MDILEEMEREENNAKVDETVYNHLGPLFSNMSVIEKYISDVMLQRQAVDKELRVQRFRQRFLTSQHSTAAQRRHAETQAMKLRHEREIKREEFMHRKIAHDIKVLKVKRERLTYGTLRRGSDVRESALL